MYCTVEKRPKEDCLVENFWLVCIPTFFFHKKESNSEIIKLVKKLCDIWWERIRVNAVCLILKPDFVKLVNHYPVILHTHAEHELTGKQRN